MAQHFRWLTRRILPLPLRTSGTARACGRSIRERHSLITARPRRISATDPVASRWSTVTFRERNRTLCAHLGNQSESVTPRSVAHRSTGSFEQSWDFLPHLESICGKTTKKYVDSNGNSRPQPQHRGPPTTKPQPSTERTISRCESSTPGNSDEIGRASCRERDERWVRSASL